MNWLWRRISQIGLTKDPQGNLWLSLNIKISSQSEGRSLGSELVKNITNPDCLVNFDRIYGVNFLSQMAIHRAIYDKLEQIRSNKTAGGEKVLRTS